ncbi:MAG: hypothetical protein JO366_12300 [Methylobacteriaceae bacterium]|nr:hypothetical protein [Methylobacteriaceae bacterium]
MKDLTAGDSVDALNVDRDEDFAGEDGVAEIGSEFGEQVCHSLGQFLAFRVEIARRQLVGEMVAPERQGVPALRRHRGVGRRLDDHLTEWPHRWDAAFSVVPRILEVVERRRDHDASAVLRPERLARQRSEIGKLSQGKVDLGAGTAGPQPGNLCPDIVGHCVLGCQAQQRRLGIGVRKDDTGPELVAVFEHHAADAAVCREELGHWRLQADLSSGTADGSGQGRGDRAHASVGDCPAAKATGELGCGMVELREGGSRSPRAGRRSRHGAVCHRSLDVIGGEESLKIIADAGKERTVQHIGAIRPGESRGKPRDRGLRLQHETADDPGDAGGVFIEFCEGSGVPRRHFGYALHCLVPVGIEEHVPAIEERHENLRLTKMIFQPVPLELQVFDDPLAKHAQHLRRRRYFEAGDELSRDASPADPVAPLEHQGRKPVSGEVGSRHEAVVPGADDDCIILGYCRPLQSG